MSKYITLPRLVIVDATAQPVWWLIGAPPITAYTGFARALTRSLCQGRAEVHHQGVAIIHHDAQFDGECFHGDLSVHQRRAVSFISKDDYAKGADTQMAHQPTARCRMVVSLVIRLPDELAVNLDTVRQFLRGGRLAGGTIMPFRHHEHMALFSSDEDEEGLKMLASGFSITDQSHLLSAEHTAGRDPLDRLFIRTRRLARPSTEQSDDNPLPWLMPTTVGYREITPRIHRSGVRLNAQSEPFLHAYAEPLVGLVQYQPFRKAGLHFWQMRTPEQGIHVAQTSTTSTLLS